MSKRQEDEGCENEMLATMYHSLVHSPTVSNLLGLEHTYAGAVSSLVVQREQAMKEINERFSIFFGYSFNCCSVDMSCLYKVTYEETVPNNSFSCLISISNLED